MSPAQQAIARARVAIAEAEASLRLTQELKAAASEAHRMEVVQWPTTART